MRNLIAAVLLVFTLGLSNTVIGKSVSFELAIANAVQGEAAILKSKDLKYKAVVVEFSAWFCSYCHRNVVNVDRLSNEYTTQKDVLFMDTLTDKNIENVGKWLIKYQPQRIVLWDSSKEFFNQIDAKFIPTMIILDSCNRIAYKHTGLWDPMTVYKIRNKISELQGTKFDCSK